MLKSNRSYNENSKKMSQEKIELHEIWKEFTTAFSYDVYYQRNKPLINVEESITFDKNEIPMESNRIYVIKKFKQFFFRHGIKISENGSLICENKNYKSILKEAKIWIMYILAGHKMNHELFSSFPEKNAENFLFLINESMINGADPISIFEFFLIFISVLGEKEHEAFMNVFKNKSIPNEFIRIYKDNKQIIDDIFRNKLTISSNFQNLMESKNFEVNNKRSTLDSPFGGICQSMDKFEKDFGRFDSINSIVNEEFDTINIEYTEKNNEDMLKSNKEVDYEFDMRNSDLNQLLKIKNKMLNKFVYNNNTESSLECVEMKQKYSLINKNYLEKGLLAIFQDNAVEAIEPYLIYPLKEKFKDYNEKEEVVKLLRALDQSIYKDYAYYPYGTEVLRNILLNS